MELTKSLPTTGCDSGSCVAHECATPKVRVHSIAIRNNTLVFCTCYTVISWSCAPIQKRFLYFSWTLNIWDLTVKLDSFHFMHHGQLLSGKLFRWERACCIVADRIWWWVGPSAVLLSRHIKEENIYDNLVGQILTTAAFCLSVLKLSQNLCNFWLNFYVCSLKEQFWCTRRRKSQFPFLLKFDFSGLLYYNNTAKFEFSGILWKVPFLMYHLAFSAKLCFRGFCLPIYSICFTYIESFLIVIVCMCMSEIKSIAQYSNLWRNACCTCLNTCQNQIDVLHLIILEDKY